MTESEDELEPFDYELPTEQIAQVPTPRRSDARLLDGRNGEFADRTVKDLAGLLAPGDVVVVNDSRVIPARLVLRRQTGGRCEVLLVEHLGAQRWKALVSPSRKVMPGDDLYHEGSAVLKVLSPAETQGSAEPRQIEILEPELVTDLAEMPLPPYIKSSAADPSRYQTVYARRPGSVAAPTAGLHFDEGVLDDLTKRGIEVLRLDLAVGIGTFRPVSAKRIADHVMHSERYEISGETWAKVNSAERVLAVGTTVLRTLESVAISGELSGETSLFIRRGFDFRVVDLLLTNFHTPRSTLLLLVDAFYGPRWRELYEYALKERYRFLSFGDAMLINRGGGMFGV